MQFDPPKGLNQAHLGAFWFTQKGEFPNVRAVQPIPTVNEAFAEQGQWLPPSFQLALTNEPESRLQMMSEDEEWMCQLQRNRLVVNWRKRKADYPRFSVTKQRFLKLWSGWQEFLAALEFTLPKPALWELAYVNRIQKKNLWESPSDWPKVFPGLWGDNLVSVDAARLRGFHGQWVWESSSPAARLYVEPKPGRSADHPAEDVLVLTLTARGPVEFNSDDGPGTVADSVARGMVFGHDLIVTTFDNAASPSAKKEWKKICRD